MIVVVDDVFEHVLKSKRFLFKMIKKYSNHMHHAMRLTGFRSNTSIYFLSPIR